MEKEFPLKPIGEVHRLIDVFKMAKLMRRKEWTKRQLQNARAGRNGKLQFLTDEEWVNNKKMPISALWFISKKDWEENNFNF